MSELFLKLLNMSITASWLILAVVLLRLVLKKAPKWVNCILWALVAVRLICPFSFESRLSLVPDTDVSDAVDVVVSQVGKAEEQAAIEEIGGADGPMVSFEAEIGMPTAPSSDSGTSNNITSIGIADIAAAVWLAGVAVLLLHALISYLRLRRRVSAAMSLGNKVWLCDAVESPFILGFFRPRIYLPSGISEGDMEHVLAHERAHLQRKDHWWKPLGYVLLAVYWFNPLIWVAYILLCRDIELACDEKVINHPETDRKAYSEALLACSVKRSAIAACPLAFGEVSVRGRIKSVLNYKKPAFWIIFVALVACIAAAVCFLTDPVEQKEADPFGQSYNVVETTYVDGSYSFVMTPENAPKFRIDENKNLIEISGERPNRMETYLGVLEETKLTRENFDDWFHPITSETGMWENGLTAAKIRRDNRVAWALTQGNENGPNCRLLLQKNGDLYLTYGLMETDQGEKRIRWLLKLEQTEDIGAISSAGDPMSNTFVTSEVDGSNPALETAVEYVAQRMETFNEGWKIIAPGNSTTRGKITALECVSTTAMENIRLDLYRLEYRMLLNGNPAAVEVGGMSHEEIDGEIWLTEWESSGQPYILHYSAMEDGRIDWKTICMTSTEEIGMIYAENKDMETQLGLDKYTIAIHKLYEKYLENESSSTAANQSILNGDAEFSDQPLEITGDPMTYQERLAWAKSGEVYTETLPDGGETSSISNGKYWEGDGCLAYLWQPYGSPHPQVRCLSIRFLDGTQAKLPLPWEQTNRTALPDFRKFQNGKFIYEIWFDEELWEGQNLIHQKGTYHYEVDLLKKTVSLWLEQTKRPTDVTVADAMINAVEALIEEKLPATIHKTDGTGRLHPVFGKLNAWDSFNGKGSCRGILEHTYQKVDSIETSDTLITLEFAVDGVDWGLTFYDGTDSLSVFTGGTEYLLQATPKQEDVFLSPLGSLIRRWYDEAEFKAMDGYDGTTIVVPNKGQSYLEAAQAWCEAYEGLHLKASSGSKECYTFVSCRVEEAESATALRREQGEIGENTYAFYAYTAFVPENEQALQWSMAGNTGNYEGDDPNVPKEALEYTRCGYITLEEDGWHGVIVGTGW